MSDAFLQQYGWFFVSLLGALLVSLMFVQGANSLVGSLGGDAEGRRLVINSTGGKWIFTFITLIMFGGALYAAFPLFWSTGFGGVHWLWMIVLLSFVLQAVGYVCRNKAGKWLGDKTIQFFLVQNGFVGPLFVGGVFATFFEGSSLLHPWVLVFGFAVFFLARILGTLYIINNVDDADIRARASTRFLGSAIAFLILFVAYLVHLFLKDGYASDSVTGIISVVPYKYFHNFLEMWYLLVLLLVGFVLVLYGIIKEIIKCKWSNSKSIWPASIGTVLIVLALLLCAGWNS